MLSTATPTSNTSPLSLHDALPISHIVSSVRPLKKTSSSTFRTSWTSEMFVAEDRPTIVPGIGQPPFTRSEERRVGKECRSRCWPYQKTKKINHNYVVVPGIALTAI